MGWEQEPWHTGTVSFDNRDPFLPVLPPEQPPPHRILLQHPCSPEGLNKGGMTWSCYFSAWRA